MKDNDMRRRLAAAGMTVLLAGLSVGVTGCGAEEADAVSLIRESGVLRVALVDTDSQFTSVEGNTPAGLEPELVKAIADSLGVTPEYTIEQRVRAQQLLSEGEADIALGCIGRSASLEEDYLLTTSYGKGYVYAVTRIGEFVSTVGALGQSAVGVDRDLDEGSRTRLYEAEGISLSDYSDAAQAAEDLASGKLRAYLCYEAEAKELLSQEGLQVQNLINLDQESYVILARENNDDLISEMNAVIRQFLENR